MSERDPRLEPFEALVGTWDTGATSSSAPAPTTSGSPTRSASSARPITGGDLVMEYVDSRGVRRTYAVALAGGVWRMWRDFPGFDQRFEAELGADSFEGVFQLARTPGEWEDDLRVTYRRRG